MAFTITPVPGAQRPNVRHATSPRRQPAQPTVAPRMTLAPPPPKPALTDPVAVLDNVSDYLDTLKRYKDRLIVLKIFAPWCRSCRALAPKFNRLAREFPEVKFVKMNYEENKDLCYRIGVTAMPTFVFYAGEAGEVEKFSCGPRRAGILSSKIEDFIRGECSLDDE